MSTAYTTLEDKLYDALYVAMGSNDNIPIIYANRNIPEPAGTHIAIRSIHRNPMGRAQKSSRVDTDGNLISVQHYEWYVQFTVVGDDSGNVSMDLACIFDSDEGLYHFARNGLSYLRRSHIRDVPKSREDGSYVLAYNQDVFFGIALEIKTQTQYIDRISYTSTYQPDGITNTVYLNYPELTLSGQWSMDGEEILDGIQN